MSTEKIAVSAALQLAQNKHPLDLVARLDWMHEMADKAENQVARDAWLAAIARTRGTRSVL